MPYIEVANRNERYWKPNKRQEDFIKIPDTVREALFGGAAGGGKSEVLLALPIVRDWINKPGFFGCIFRRTVPQLEESLIPRAKKLYSPLGAKFNENKNEFKFPPYGDECARIKLDFLETDDHARNKDTTEYNYVGFDELTHFNEFQYKYITFSRLRGEIRVSRGGTNPGNEGHVWVRDRFIIPAPGGYKLIRNNQGLLRMFIPSLVTDNDWLMENDPDYVKALHELPEAEKRAKLYGDWFSFLGQVFTEWRIKPYVDEPDNARHVIPAFDIPYWWPKVAAIDWGHKAYTWMGWAAISPDMRAFLYREYHNKEKNISEWASHFKAVTAGENLKSVVIDPSAKQQRGDPRSIIKQFIDHSGYTPRLADNDRISGKMLMHEMLRWKAKEQYVPPEGFSEERYYRISQHVNKKAADAYKNLFREIEPELNLPKLQVFETCKAFAGAIPLARYDDKKVEDVAEWEPTEKSPGDDPYDGGRYLVKEIDRYIKSIANEESPTKDVDNAIKALDETGDQYDFYRRMEKIEAAVEERRGRNSRRLRPRKRARGSRLY